MNVLTQGTMRPPTPRARRSELVAYQSARASVTPKIDGATSRWKASIVGDGASHRTSEMATPSTPKTAPVAATARSFRAACAARASFTGSASDDLSCMNAISTLPKPTERPAVSLATKSSRLRTIRGASG